MMILEKKPEIAIPEPPPKPKTDARGQTKRSCLNCNIRDGEPFLCADCQWHVYQACGQLRNKLEKMIKEVDG